MLQSDGAATTMDEIFKQAMPEGKGRGKHDMTTILKLII